MAVPRVYEKFEERLNTLVQDRWSKSSKDILQWALKKGAENTQAQVQGEISPFGFNIAKALALDSLRNYLGLQEVEQLFYGAAPMRQ